MTELVAVFVFFLVGIAFWSAETSTARTITMVSFTISLLSLLLFFGRMAMLNL